MNGTHTKGRDNGTTPNKLNKEVMYGEDDLPSKDVARAVPMS